MTKLITSEDKVVIKLEFGKLLMSQPILLEGQKQILGNTFAGMIAHTAWKFIKDKRPGALDGKKFARTTVELIGNEIVVTFTKGIRESGYDAKIRQETCKDKS